MAARDLIEADTTAATQIEGLPWPARLNTRAETVTVREPVCQPIDGDYAIFVTTHHCDKEEEGDN
jgi:hypothetical protein